VSLAAARKLPLIRAVAFAVALVICGGSVDWGHAGGDDPDCDLVLVHQNVPGHVSTAPIGAPQSENHCYICHALRLLHSALTSAGIWHGVLPGSTPLGSSERVIARREASIGRTPRAPPVSL
jgi:hypothetical protein